MSVEVEADVSVGDICVRGDVSIVGGVSIGGNVSVGGDLSVQGGVSVGGDLSVQGGVNVGGDMSVRGKVSVGGNRSVGGAVSIGGVGDVSVGDVSVGDVSVGDVSVGDVSVGGGVSVGGDVRIGSVRDENVEGGYVSVRDENVEGGDVSVQDENVEGGDVSVRDENVEGGDVSVRDDGGDVSVRGDENVEGDASIEADRSSCLENLVEVARQLGIEHDFSTLSRFVSSGSIAFQPSGTFQVHNTACSWNQHYAVLSFLLNGHLHSEYARLSGMLGLPPCSHTQWQNILKRLEPHVAALAEWSCGQVRKEIVMRGDEKKWIASFDGFYLTRGHYSNNASASMHDFVGGGIAWYTHRTKRGPGHNWEGTSAGAEGDMFNEVLGLVKAAGFGIQEIITDKDSSTNAIFCRHFPEGTITYCHNHCAKTLHKDLEKIRKNKCEVSSFKYSVLHLLNSFAV